MFFELNGLLQADAGDKIEQVRLCKLVGVSLFPTYSFPQLIVKLKCERSYAVIVEFMRVSLSLSLIDQSAEI